MDIRDKYPPELKTDDGHFVRSKAEMLIDNWLFKNNIPHAYEVSVFLPNNPDQDLYCDFFLPTYGIYIEYWGLEGDKSYDLRKEQKIELYLNNSLKRIDLDESHIKRLNDVLPKILAGDGEQPMDWFRKLKINAKED